MIFSRPLMEIFGREFGEGWPVLVIAILGQLMNCGVGSVGQLLLMSGNQQKMARAQAIVAFVGVAINWLLIPRLGLIGAAVAAATANTLLNGLWLWYVHRTLALHPSRRGYFSLILPALVTVASIGLVRYGFRDSRHYFLSPPIVMSFVAGPTGSSAFWHEPGRLDCRAHLLSARSTEYAPEPRSNKTAATAMASR